MPPCPPRTPATMPDPQAEPAAEPAMLSAAAVARRCVISLRHVRRLIASHALPVHRLGRVVRIAEGDLEGFLTNNRNRVPVSAKP